MNINHVFAHILTNMFTYFSIPDSSWGAEVFIRKYVFKHISLYRPRGLINGGHLFHLCTNNEINEINERTQFIQALNYSEDLPCFT